MFTKELGGGGMDDSFFEKECFPLNYIMFKSEGREYRSVPERDKVSSDIGVLKVYRTDFKEGCAVAFDFDLKQAIDEGIVVLGLECLKKLQNGLGLTLLRNDPEAYLTAFKVYTFGKAIGKAVSEEAVPKPSYTVFQKPTDHLDFLRSTPCWLHPYWFKSSSEILPYTTFLLAQVGPRYISMASVSSSCTISYITSEGIKVFIGKEANRISKSWVLVAAEDDDPYRAIEKLMKVFTRVTCSKLRDEKHRPLIMDGLGWCSWNAFTTDVTAEGIISIITKLKRRGIKVKWIIVDDGWQNEITTHVKASGIPGWMVRVLDSIKPDEKKFPNGFSGFVQQIKSTGVDFVGLWHTLNLHWGGFSENVCKELDAEAFLNPFTNTYQPPLDLIGALKLYKAFASYLEKEGFDFVKVDNQWVIHPLTYGSAFLGSASSAVEKALQLAFSHKGLDILNCMSMAPENYSNYFWSNIMRISEDYVPFWRDGAKLHAIYNAYNTLFLNHIIYPDYDMWITYDEASRLHAVLRAFSGGPIYITDREVEKTDIELLNMLTLPNGEVIRVDFPAIPTRDILFENPYISDKLLKLASRANGVPVIAVFNVSREDKELEDVIKLDQLPFVVDKENVVYYMIFARKGGKLDHEIKLKLKPLDCEVVLLKSVKDKHPLGLEGFILPPCAISYVTSSIIMSKASGKLIIIDSNGKISFRNIKQDEVIDLEASSS